MNMLYYILIAMEGKSQLNLSQRVNIYISTLFVYASFIMIVGVIARIKDPMSKEFGLT